MTVSVSGKVICRRKQFSENLVCRWGIETLLLAGFWMAKIEKNAQQDTLSRSTVSRQDLKFPADAREINKIVIYFVISRN